MPESASGGVCLVQGGLPQYLVGYHHPPPPVNRMTNRCKNITLATTSSRPVIRPGRDLGGGTPWRTLDQPIIYEQSAEFHHHRGARFRHLAAFDERLFSYARAHWTISDREVVTGRTLETQPGKQILTDSSKGSFDRDKRINELTTPPLSTPPLSF